MKENFNCYLKEKNIIQNYSKTHFYLNIEADPICYGVAFNEKDLDNKDEIIKRMKENRKEQLRFWNEEQYQRNLQNKKIFA